MAKRLVQHPKVTVMWNVSCLQPGTCSHAKIQTVATECKGDGDLLQSLALENTKTGEKSELQVNGLFYAIGTSSPIISKIY
jgi:thioredoxin reductase (NADPH)